MDYPMVIELDAMMVHLAAINSAINLVLHSVQPMDLLSAQILGDTMAPDSEKQMDSLLDSLMVPLSGY